MKGLMVWGGLFVLAIALPSGVGGVLLLLMLAYLLVALGFRMGKTVGAGAERHAFRQQAAREGGYLFLGVPKDDALRGA